MDRFGPRRVSKATWSKERRTLSHLDVEEAWCLNGDLLLELCCLQQDTKEGLKAGVCSMSEHTWLVRPIDGFILSV